MVDLITLTFSVCTISRIYLCKIGLSTSWQKNYAFRTLKILCGRLEFTTVYCQVLFLQYTVLYCTVKYSDQVLLYCILEKYLTFKYQVQYSLY